MSPGGFDEFAIDANYYGQVFYISGSSTVEMKNLTIRGGLIAGGGGGSFLSGDNSLGAGIYNDGNLTLRDVNVTANVFLRRVIDRLVIVSILFSQQLEV